MHTLTNWQKTRRDGHEIDPVNSDCTVLCTTQATHDVARRRAGAAGASAGDVCNTIGDADASMNSESDAAPAGPPSAHPTRAMSSPAAAPRGWAAAASGVGDPAAQARG